MQKRARSVLLAYGAALPALAVAVVARWQLDSVLGPRALYSTFFPAVMIAAYFGGFWPGILVTIVATAAANATIDPRLTLQLKGPGDTLAMLLFVLTGAIISGLSESLHRSRYRLVTEERLRAERTTREAEERFRQMAENIQEIFWVADLGHTHIMYVSPGYDQVWGRSSQSLYDQPRSWFDSVHPDDRDRVVANLEQRRQGIFNDLEFRILRPDGSLRWIRSRAFPINDPEGRLSRVAGLAEDITDRKRAELEVRQAKELLELAVRGSNLSIWEFEMPDGRIEAGRPTFINVWELLGYDASQAPSDVRAAFELAVHADDRDQVARAVSACLGGQALEFEAEYRVLHKDGSIRWNLSRGVAVRDQTGRPSRFIGSSVDITDLKQAGAALRESEHRFRMFVDHATDAFFLFDENNIVLDVNRRACESLGYTRDELLGMTPIDFDPDMNPVRLDETRRKLHEGGLIAFESRHRRKDGAVYPVEVRGQTFREGGRLFAVSLARDVTERNRAEDALRQSEERFRGTFENAAVGIGHVDAGGRWVRVNQRLCDILGYSRDELLAKTFQEITHFDDLSGSLEPFARLWRGELPSYSLEKRYVRRDGSPIWIETTVSLKREVGGRPVYTIAIVQDISQRKRLAEELRQAKEAAESANRAKDEFLANVSHEIRTPMNAILGMTELVLDTPLADEQRQSLSTVKSAGDSLLGIINDLLDFSKIEARKLELDPADFSLRTTVRDTLQALAMRAHGKGLELVSNVHPEVPDALIGDSGRLRQVLLNLVGNAIKFTARGEVVVDVAAAADPMPADGCVGVRFAVRDTGIGIPREKRTTIFRAFEQEDTSTTRKYGGTGLGLTIAAQLVSLMGGSIAVESEVNRGSTFSFTAQFGRQPNPQAATAAAPNSLLHGLRVLVVDDNATNRQVIEQWLSVWGMDATTAGDGMAAMDALWHAVAAGRPYRLLLIDARMPDDAGLEVATKIRTRAELSDTRVILLTSGDRSGDGARFRDLRVDGHLLKPLQQHELLETIITVTSRSADDQPETAQPKASAGPAPVTFPPSTAAVDVGLRILVAEDSEFNAQLLEKLLVKRGHSVRLVPTGREALALASVFDFDLMLLDVHMPEMDGFDVIRGIREREQVTGGHLPVIALTARSRKEDRERCLAAGMDDFLAKPIQTDQFWSTIERVADVLAAVHGQPDTALVDARAALAACGGDGDVFKSLRDALRTQLPIDVKAVREAFDDRDVLRLREAAHKLAGMVAAFSTRTGAVASDVEDLAAHGQLNDAAAPVAQLYRMAGALLQSVEGLSIDALRRDAGG